MARTGNNKDTTGGLELGRVDVAGDMARGAGWGKGSRNACMRAWLLSERGSYLDATCVAGAGRTDDEAPAALELVGDVDFATRRTLG